MLVQIGGGFGPKGVFPHRADVDIVWRWIDFFVLLSPTPSHRQPHTRQAEKMLIQAEDGGPADLQ